MTQGAKPVLAVDIDEVLFPFTPNFLIKHNKEHGASVAMSDLTTYYYLEELYGITVNDEAEDVVEAFLHEAYEGNIGPYNGAIEAVTKLKDTYDISIITSRRPSMHAITIKWLDKHFPGIFKEVHIPRMQDGSLTKADICTQIGAEWLIEDQPAHIQGVTEAGTRVLLFGEYPWNKDADLPEGAQRVKDWNEVLEALL